MRRKKQYVPRDPIRDYFPLPNEIFSLGLSTGEIAVYAYLMYCEDQDVPVSSELLHQSGRSNCEAI